jgi:hypothetical protein
MTMVAAGILLHVATGAPAAPPSNRTVNLEVEAHGVPLISVNFEEGTCFVFGTDASLSHRTRPSTTWHGSFFGPQRAGLAFLYSVLDAENVPSRTWAVVVPQRQALTASMSTELLADQVFSWCNPSAVPREVWYEGLSNLRRVDRLGFTRLCLEWVGWAGVVAPSWGEVSFPSARAGRGSIEWEAERCGRSARFCGELIDRVRVVDGE